jgi:DNA-binding winged helix-turn-helix (wHTH) protein/tetratricopeptide (TPR) repeat protein
VLKLSDLAQRPDFKLGPLSISPSRRRVEGPAGAIHLEPLVMQVFLLLLDARGEVITRDELFGKVWGGAMVGDDSLNRTIAGVRRIATETAPGLFEIETIPRTGYRLTGEVSGFLHEDLDGRRGRTRLSRRALVGGGVAATALLGAGGLWWADAREDREFEELMARGQSGLERSDPSYNTQQYFRRAVALRPNDAKAQGQFAYSRLMRAESVEFDDIGSALQEAERAARTALAIDPNQPDARLAQIVIQRSMLDFASTEDRVRAVLATAPDNLAAMRQMWVLLQCVGRSRDSLAMIERALGLYPLAPGCHYPRAQLLWILGRTAEADRVIDRALQYWPWHRFVRFARFSIFAYTGRPRAALAMLERKETTPQNFSPASVALWRESLAALDQRSPASIAAARRANLEAAKRDLRLAPQAASALSALGEIDAAFEIAEAHFAIGRPAELHPQVAANRPPIKGTAWRFAPWLFTPPTAPMRADPRFKVICDEIGLAEYWAKRGIKPDYQLGIT